MPRFRQLWLFALGGILGVAWPAESPAGEWSAVTEARVLYTDNVSELSATRRLALSEDPSQPTIVPLKKPQDVVWEPFLDLRHRSSNPLGSNEVSLKAAGFIYTDHTIFNHGNYRVQVKQAFSPDTSLVLRYRYVPNLFLGPNNERRTGARLLEEERVTSHVWRAQLEQRLSQAWTGTLIARYGIRLFNEAFAERDTKFWTLGSQAEVAVTSRITVVLSYLFERGAADGRDEVQFRDDVSYRQHFASLGATIALGRGSSWTWPMRIGARSSPARSWEIRIEALLIRPTSARPVYATNCHRLQP
ncbi:MAG: hypothetical protein U0231_04855 [Nitrospiraceae bacterium]